MFSLRGNAPCRSVLKQSPCVSARLLPKPFQPASSLRQPRNNSQFSAWESSFRSHNYKSHLRCSAQSEETEAHTPEILDDLEEPSTLHSALHASEEQQPSQHGGAQQLASWALAGQHRGVTTLLGFAGAAFAGLSGEYQACYTLERVGCQPVLCSCFLELTYM